MPGSKLRFPKQLLSGFRNKGGIHHLQYNHVCIHSVNDERDFQPQWIGHNIFWKILESQITLGYYFKLYVHTKQLLR